MIAMVRSMVFVETQDEKYYDSYTRSPSQFNSFDWGNEKNIKKLKKSRKRTKHPLQFGIALMNLTFSLVHARFVVSMPPNAASIESERKKSKYFKCSYQVFPVHHRGFMKSFSTLA